MLALAFVVDKHNLNSVAALTGALEVDPRTSALQRHFLWRDEELLPRMRDLARAHRLVSALSFATAHWPEMAGLLAELRDLEPRPWLVAGGPHPSARPSDLLAAGVDAVVVGEGCETLPALLARIQAGEAPAGLPGVSTRAADGRLVRGRQLLTSVLDRHQLAASPTR